MIVVDASALIDLLIGRPGAKGLRDRVTGAGSMHVPHLLDTEVQSALRGLVSGRKLGADRARDALSDLERLPLARYPAHPLSTRVWDLRANVTSYDATYVALAEVLGCPLVTCDRRLSRASKVATVEVF